MPEPTLRELSRRAVKQRLADIAVMLFAERGYDATTVEEIARIAGISSRTFFRYFETKDAVLFDRADDDARALVTALNGRPAEESPWESLEHIVEEQLGVALEDPEERERSRLLRTALGASPELTAHHLAHVAASQQLLSDALWRRWISIPAHDPNDSDTRVVLRALVGSMLGVLTEVMLSAEDQPPAEQRRLVRATLAAIRPGRADLGGPARTSDT